MLSMAESRHSTNGHRATDSADAVGATAASRLAVLGIGAASSAVYEALLSLPPSTASELEAETLLTPRDVRASLNRLVDLGLVTKAGPARRSVFTAVDPGYGLSRLIGEHEEALRLVRHAETELTSAFHRARAVRDPKHIVELVTGSAQIVARERHLSRAAQTQVRAFDQPPYHFVNDMNQPELDLLQKGGTVRAIYATAGLLAEERVPMVRAWMEAGEDARTLPVLPTKLFIYDDDAALLPLREPTSAVPSPTFIIVRPSSLLEALIALFEMLWERALPLSFTDPALSPGAEAGADLSDEERALVTHLTSGLSDDAIARRLQVSPRTYHRRLKALMSRYHAETRFQLGIQLTAEGLIPVSARTRTLRD